jgi:hypothetical protein
MELEKFDETPKQILEKQLTVSQWNDIPPVDLVKDIRLEGSFCHFLGKKEVSLRLADFSRALLEASPIQGTHEIKAEKRE